MVVVDRIYGSLITIGRNLRVIPSGQGSYDAQLNVHIIARIRIQQESFSYDLGKFVIWM